MAKKRKNEKYFGEKCVKCGSFYATSLALAVHTRYCMLRSSSSRKCDHCGKTFLTIAYLNRHKKRVSGQLSATCEICNRALSTKSHLIRHMKTVHSSNHPERPKYPDGFTCGICNMTFRIKKYLLRHKRIHLVEDTPKIICKICSVTLSSKNSLRRHNIRKHLDEYFNHKRRSKIAKEQRKKEKEENVNKNNCVMCGKTFSGQKGLFLHLLTHTEENPFICKLCQKEYRRVVSLGRHYLKKHGKEGRKLFNKLKIKRDLTEPKRSLVYSCSICWKKIVRPSFVLDHVVRFHDANFTTANKVMTKLREGGNVSPPSVTISKVSKNKRCIKNKKALPPRNNVCYICGGRFHCEEFALHHIKLCEKTHEIFLKTNILSTENSDARPTCPVCGTDMTKINLKNRSRHIKTCGRLCLVCKRVMKDGVDRDEHIADCKKRRKFKCPHCSSSFMTKIAINAHVKMFHKRVKDS